MQLGSAVCLQQLYSHPHPLPPCSTLWVRDADFHPKQEAAEIAMLDNYIVVYKFVQDLHFFVTAGDDENELIIATVLQGFVDAVGLLLRNEVDKRMALENLDLILLCLDEIVDGGIILETDASVIAGKVASHGLEGAGSLSEQTISQALATAREHLARSLLK
ncbi:coatomer subunit zeta-2-like isoform X3 [Phoenix dactylifera]|uniref:Coatomer subunit zeta n=1 Tax=Phoenix dactylifera TaxID=42345 RepID=A0A8B9ARD3_PHODC|nr:coatomer subunit zeta-2-like isoform X3 [Phoenix dactylifera]